jgi:hypothetical protein
MFRLFLTILTTVFCSASYALHSNIAIQNRDNETWVTVKVDVGTAAKADVLFIIDDSGSMGSHQKHLAQQADLIAKNLSFYNDVNVAVITSSNKAWTGAANSGGKFVGPVLNSTQSNFTVALSQQLLVGTNGDSTEKFLVPLFAATTEPLLSTTNKGFLRDSSDLILMFLTDTEDSSTTVSANDLWSHLTAIKSNSSVHVIATTISDLATCPGEQHELETITVLKDFVTLSGGQTIDLCSDFSQEVPKAIKNIKKSSKEITISALPNTTIDSKTLSVSANGTALPAGDLFNGWAFDPIRSVVIIGDNVINTPNFNSLEITYKLNPL